MIYMDARGRENKKINCKMHIPSYANFKNIVDEDATLEDIEEEFNLEIKDYEIRRNLPHKELAKIGRSVRLKDIENIELEGTPTDINALADAYNPH